MRSKDLITEEYRQMNAQLHEGKFGHRGFKHGFEAIRFANVIGAETVLDYGAGKATLGEKLRHTGLYKSVRDYDPAIPEISALPEQADLVLCTDVMEHVEEQFVDNVIKHIYDLAKKGAYFLISTEDTQIFLPDGRQAHITIRSEQWWINRMRQHNWDVSFAQKGKKEIQVWCVKREAT